MEEIIEKIIRKTKYHKKQKNLLCDSIQKILRNTPLPLEERWLLFTTACEAKILPTHPFIQHLTALENAGIEVCEPYFYFYEKYRNISYTMIIEAVENRQEECREHSAWAEDYWLKVDINALKEEILAKGDAGFIMDW